MNDFQHRFERFIREQNLLRPGQSLLLAVSGGVDSMVMLSLFSELADSWHLALAVGHVNHGLRGAESDGDERFVREQSQSLRIPFHSTRVETERFARDEKRSLQDAARALRYEYLETVRRRTGADVIATAHQANDNAETILFHALRGAGVRGLSGIALIRRDIPAIRPLLFASRGEIERFARERKVGFRLDSSNLSTAYTRNFLRQTVIPALEREFDPDVVRSLNRVGRIMSGYAAELETRARQKMTSLIRNERGRTVVDLSGLQSEPGHLQEEIILELFRTRGVEPNAGKVRAFKRLFGQATGRSIRLSKDLTALRDRDRIILAPAVEPAAGSHILRPGESYRGEEFSISVSSRQPAGTMKNVGPKTLCVDADSVGGMLTVRHWRAGDWFVPLGLGKRKKLSDFFVDRKVSRDAKPRIPILDSERGIVWVCGMRPDERFKVRPETQSVLQLTYDSFV